MGVNIEICKLFGAIGLLVNNLFVVFTEKGPYPNNFLDSRWLIDI